MMMLAPTTSFFVIIIYPRLILAFHLAGNVNRSYRPCTSPSSHRRRWGRSNYLRKGGMRTTTLFLHYNDFTEFELIHHADEPTPNGQVYDSNNNELASIPLSLPSLFPLLQESLESSPISYSSIITNSILQQLTAAGFVDDNDITQFARGFLVREEELSQILIQDFGWKALDAHRARVGIISLVREELKEGNGMINQGSTVTEAQSTTKSGRLIEQEGMSTSKDAVSPMEVRNRLGMVVNETIDSIKPALWKSVLVNDKAKKRRANNNLDKARHVQNGDDANAVTTVKNGYNYGLLQATSGDDTDRMVYVTLYAELDSFWSYMTIPQTSAVSDATIRDQTAKVYLTHARLFLGWVVDARGVLDEDNQLAEVRNEGSDEQEKQITSSLEQSFSGISSSPTLNTAKNVRKQVWKYVLDRKTSSFTTDGSKADTLRHGISLYDIFPNSQTESASPVLQYILWLRAERGISPNYEANILRGIIKLVKFRFADEASSQLLLSKGNDAKHKAMSARLTPLDNLPIVYELRKLHREAGNKGKKAPRSSDEGKKWLDWSDYLTVIQLLKSDLMEMINKYDGQLRMDGDLPNAGTLIEQPKTLAKEKTLYFQRKEIAKTYQYYLILAFFAQVPDRQRTFRELELGRNFFKVKDDKSGSSMWVIKHTAEDYKTGSTYGERPPLPLTEALTPEIDDFLERWRPTLLHQPSDGSAISSTPSSYLFLQPRTGNPLTANSVYQIVSRCCYKYKQKKTNPHLLRDMIVTHVRKNADASEKELEALALFMGHSITMQRDSYDRRTLEQKVSPAIKLMQNMNAELIDSTLKLWRSGA